jgi:dTDP-4-dehydrorhamnose reductase
MKILLFGGSGLLGKELQGALGAHTVLAPSHTDVDIADEAEVTRIIDDTKPDLVINAAAYINVNALEHDPLVGERINEQGAGVVARVAAKHRLPLVHISTSYVFADSDVPYAEDGPRMPTNVYGQTKSRGEDLVRASARKAKQYIVRTSWVYSPARATFIDEVAAALVQGKTVEASEQRGNPTYAKELAEAIVHHFVESTQQSGIYHLTNAGGASRYEIALEIARCLGIPEECVVKKEFSPSALRPSVVLLNTKLPPLPPWQESLRTYIKARYV